MSGEFKKYEDIPQAVDNAFDTTLGRRYATINELCPHIDEVRSATAELLTKMLKERTQENFEIIEPGCGSGKETVLLLGADPRVRITGIDNVATMLDQIKNDPRLKVVQEDAVDYLLKTPEDSFDGVASALFTHNMTPERRAEYYNALGRAIKPNGIYINLDVCVPDDIQEHQKYIDQQLENVKHIETFDPEAAKAWRKHMMHDAAPEMRFTEGEQQRLLEASGFTDIQLVLRKRLETIFTAVKKDVPKP
jgi:SAM-dependent methyltransferase